MATEILKSFGTLQSELEHAKDSLKGVDENIKRLLGRDPSELPPRANQKRGAANDRQKAPRGRAHENEEPAAKRRAGISVFKRLDRPNPYEDDLHPHVQKQIISKVIVTPKELPSRQDALDAQSKDERSKARNRRMFGALLGTLQKFQQEETKLKQKEDKRARVEKRIEEHEIKEKEEIQKERQELFFNRKKKQAEIKMIELKMVRMKEYAAWEERQKPRMHFIQTKAKPHIHFLPRKMNDATKPLLDAYRLDIEKMIDKKRQEVYDELQHIEDRMKKNFGAKKTNNGESVEDEIKGNEEEDEEEEKVDEKDDAVIEPEINEEEIANKETNIEEMEVEPNQCLEETVEQAVNATNENSESANVEVSVTVENSTSNNNDSSVDT